MSDSEEIPTTVNNVAISTPFIESNIPAWFSLIEAQFNIRNFRRSDIKFYHALNALPHNIVASLPLSVLDARDYEILKKEVIASFERSKPEMLDRLMSERKISGKPSAFLKEIRTLATKIGVGEDIIRHRFIKALPPSIAPVLAAHLDLDLDRLGKIADDLAAQFAHSTHSHVQQVLSRPRNNNYSSNNHYSNNNNDNNNSNHNNNKQSNIPAGLRPFYNEQKPQVCRSHLYFGDNARYCKPWCKWPDKRRTTMQPSSRPSSPVPNFSGN